MDKNELTEGALIIMNGKMILSVAAVFCVSLLGGAEHEFRGKKLIHAGWADGTIASVRKNIRQIEESAPVYSGMRIIITGQDEEGKTVTHRMMFGRRKFKYEYFKQAVEDLRATEFKRFTDNFLATGVQPGKIDWFSDEDWEGVCNNFAIFARIAKEAGMKGLIFDSEEYSGKFWWFKNVAGHTREECIETARKRGRQFGKAVFGTFPECRLFCFFWLSLNRDKQEDPDCAQLSAHFIDGVYDVLPPQARIYDGMENEGYRLRDRNDLNRAVKAFYQDFPKMLSPENRSKYFAQTRMGMSIYLDAYFSLKPNQSYAYWLAAGKEKYGAADFFRRNLQITMEGADEYAWTWGEHGTWWEIPGSKRKTWESYAPGARQALLDGMSPVAAAERIVKEKNRPNLLVNTSFQERTGKDVPANWTAYQTKRLSSGTVEFPQNSGQAVFRGTIAASIYQQVPVTPGKEYFVTAKGILKPSPSSPGARLKINIEFRNGKGELTGFDQRRSKVFRPAGPDGELKGAMIFDVPDDAVTLVLHFKAENLEKDAEAAICAPALYER